MMSKKLFFMCSVAFVGGLALSFSFFFHRQTVFSAFIGEQKLVANLSQAPTIPTTLLQVVPAGGTSKMKPIPSQPIEKVVSTKTIPTAILRVVSSAPLPQINKAKETLLSKGAVTLRFDDGWDSQYYTALPIMDAAGFRGTFYIISKQILDTEFSGFVSKAQVRELFAHGNEIGAHTQSHPHLPSLSAEDQKAEIAGSRKDLQAWHVGSILSFAYPYGEYNSTTLSLVKDAGFISAAATESGNVVRSASKYELASRSVELSTSLGDVKEWIDIASRDKQWLILTFHRIDTSGDPYSVTPENFVAIVAYLKGKGVPVVTVSQGVAAF